MEDNINNNTSYFMPDGSHIPIVLNDEELIQLLRLDEQGPHNARTTLKYYRDKGLLKGTRLGKKIRYTRDEVVKFLERQTAETNKRRA